MKLTKAQREFVDRVLQIEKDLEEKLWLKATRDGKWIMQTRDSGYYIDVHGRTVNSLLNKNVLDNAEFYNEHTDSLLTGMTLSEKYRSVTA